MLGYLYLILYLFVYSFIKASAYVFSWEEHLRKCKKATAYVCQALTDASEVTTTLCVC
jgi:hypothetical protein